MKFSSEFVFLYAINKADNYTQLEMEQIKLQSNEIISSYLNKTTENASHRFGYQTKKIKAFAINERIHSLSFSNLTAFQNLAIIICCS